ncbi:MAG: hypothetical protein P8X63_14420 [Desulfuromonadaceae bacterium]
MKILPLYEFEIKTQMSLQQVTERTESFVEKKNFFRLFHEGKPYRGELFQDGFKISRISLSRRLAALVSHGTYKQEGTGTTIRIKMRLNPLVIALVSIWTGCIIAGTVSCCFKAINQGNSLGLPMLIPFGMIMFVIALVVSSFWFEVRKQSSLLKSLFWENKSDGN